MSISLWFRLVVGGGGGPANVRLLEDGTSRRLLEDGTSFRIKEGA